MTPKELREVLLDSPIRPGAKMLIEAADIIDSRGASYGHPRPNHERIARIWTAMMHDLLKDPDDHPLTAALVARLMIGLKLARLEETPNHMDSIMDVMGYAACLAEIETA